MSRYIDADKLKEFWWNPESGTEEIINDLISKYDLRDYEVEVIKFARELLERVNNVIDTEPTVDVKEVVRGKWKDQGYAQDTICSNCRQGWDNFDYDHNKNLIFAPIVVQI